MEPVELQLGKMELKNLINALDSTHDTLQEQFDEPKMHLFILNQHLLPERLEEDTVPAAIQNQLSYFKVTKDMQALFHVVIRPKGDVKPKKKRQFMKDLYLSQSKQKAENSTH